MTPPEKYKAGLYDTHTFSIKFEKYISPFQMISVILWNIHSVHVCSCNFNHIDKPFFGIILAPCTRTLFLDCFAKIQNEAMLAAKSGWTLGQANQQIYSPATLINLINTEMFMILYFCLKQRCLIYLYWSQQKAGRKF